MRAASTERSALPGAMMRAPAPRPQKEVNLGRQVERLTSKWAEAADADYFGVLGLPRSAGREEVARAFQQLASEFDPVRFAGHPDAAIRLTAQRLAELLSEAATALADDRLRADYARNLAD